MKPFLDRIGAGEILVADGAIGSLLISRGLAPGQCPETFNLSRPDVLEEIAGLYLQAGADLIQTNTFGASPMKLEAFGLGQRMEEINRNAVRAARKAVGDDAYVYASCGPSGKMVLPYGDTHPDELFENFSRQIDVVIAEKVDLICVETMTDLQEAVLAIRAIRSISQSIPVMASMTFESTRKGFFTIMGNRIHDVARELREAGADVVGSNCGNGIENMIRIAKEFRQATDAPLLIQSNAGLPRLEDGKLFYPESPAFMSEKSREFSKVGVAVVGGCCGTTPDHIKEFVRVLKGTPV
jgi:5-methyltetrahydrofolate--homocysteine methyltransferase